MKLLNKRKAAIQSQHHFQNIVTQSSKRKNNFQKNVHKSITKYKKKYKNEALKAFVIQLDLQRYTDMMYRHIFEHKHIPKILADHVVKKLSNLKQECKKTPQLYQVWEKLSCQFKNILEGDESSTESDLSELCNYKSKKGNDLSTKPAEKITIKRINSGINQKDQRNVEEVIDLTDDSIINLTNNANNECIETVCKTKDKLDNLKPQSITNSSINTTIEKKTVLDQEINIEKVSTNILNVKSPPRKRGRPLKKKVDIENQNSTDKETSPKPKKNNPKNKKANPWIQKQTSDLKSNELNTTKLKISKGRKEKNNLNNIVVDNQIIIQQETIVDSQETQIGVGEIQMIQRRKESEKTLTYSQIDNEMPTQIFSEVVLDNQDLDMSSQMFHDILKQSDKLITNNNQESQTFSEVLIHSQSQTIQQEIQQTSSGRNEKESQTDTVNSDTQINSCIEGLNAINLETMRNKEIPKTNSNADISKLCATHLPNDLQDLELNNGDFFSQMDSNNEFACYDWLKNINYVHVKDDSYKHELFEVDNIDWSRDFD